jgi:hypothetical protein
LAALFGLALVAVLALAAGGPSVRGGNSCQPATAAADADLLPDEVLARWRQCRPRHWRDCLLQH